MPPFQKDFQSLRRQSQRKPVLTLGETGRELRLQE
jgi:hypothetical protein